MDGRGPVAADQSDAVPVLGHPAYHRNFMRFNQALYLKAYKLLYGAALSAEQGQCAYRIDKYLHYLIASSLNRTPSAVKIKAKNLS